MNGSCFWCELVLISGLGEVVGVEEAANFGGFGDGYVDGGSDGSCGEFGDGGGGLVGGLVAVGFGLEYGLHGLVGGGFGV